MHSAILHLNLDISKTIRANLSANSSEFGRISLARKVFGDGSIKRLATSVPMQPATTKIELSSHENDYKGLHKTREDSARQKESACLEFNIRIVILVLVNSNQMPELYSSYGFCGKIHP